MSGTVLLRRSSLGDVVLLGAVSATAPGPVVVVTAPQYASIARRLQGVQEVVAWGDTLSGSALRARVPAGATWVDLQGSLRSLWMMRWASGARSRVDKHSVRRRLRLRLPLEPRPSVVEQYAKAVGVEVATYPWVAGRKPGERLVLIPGATWGTKRWGEPGWQRVGREWPGPVSVVGGPGDEVRCARIAAGIPGAKWTAKVGFDEAMSAMSDAAAAVGGDTGLTHLAAAMGVPVVTLFGPTHPDDGFAVHPGEIVQRSLDCRPCSLHGDERCPLGHHACMDISSNDVSAAVWAVACAG